jgi:isopentenyl-diphosphate delta-isomerase
LIGTVDESVIVKPNPHEVSDWKWMKIDDMKKELKDNPDLYTPWFHLSLSMIA